MHMPPLPFRPHPQVVVTQTLDWKLAHFDLASEHQFASPYDLPLAAAAWLLPPQYKAGEVAKGDWQVRCRCCASLPCFSGILATAKLPGAKLGLLVCRWVYMSRRLAMLGQPCCAAAPCFSRAADDPTPLRPTRLGSQLPASSSFSFATPAGSEGGASLGGGRLGPGLPGARSVQRGAAGAHRGPA